jgi:hypothetical protein
MSTDFDSPWKEALDEFLEPCFALLFPFAHAEIDWSIKPEPLDKELQQITPSDEVGRRYVDKLYRVHLKKGGVSWVLIHMEVQTSRDGDFEKRMFVYNYRAFNARELPVASFAVLADDEPNRRPAQFGWTILGCTHLLQFPTVKLLDWAPRWQELEADPNPFAKVVLAHLKTQETRNDPAARHLWKVRFVRALYEQGLAEAVLRRLFRIIDWQMDLSPALDRVFWREVKEIQEALKMPFITTPQRVERWEGMMEGIEIALQVKFPDAAPALFAEIQQVHDIDKLRVIVKAIPSANSPEDLRRLWAPHS